VEVKATAAGCSRAFIEEHEALFQENIRLKATVKQLMAK